MTDGSSAASSCLSPEELRAGLEAVRLTPRDRGLLELIVCRPAVGERQAISEARLDVTRGLVGDNWETRGRSGGQPANPDAQLTVMNARAAALIAGSRERWPLAGDQFYIDLDLSCEHLPPGTQLAVGTAVIEVTAAPHTGCAKFRERFGAAAMELVNSREGRSLNLRGINARIVASGVVRVGETVLRL